MRTRGCDRHGLILLELIFLTGAVVLVVVSLLVPAVGRARAEARVTIDAQSLKEHANGIAIYGASQRDTLPHAPEVKRGMDARYGSAGRPAFRFGDEAWPTPAGFGFPEPVPTVTGPGAEDYVRGVSRWGQMSLFDSYWHVLAPYMVDGEGVDALMDVFYSTGDPAGKRSRAVIRERLGERRGAWWNVQEHAASDRAYAPTSFRYVSQAMVDPEFYTPENEGRIDESWLDDRGAFYEHTRRNTWASVAFPSQKQMVFTWEAFHNDDLQVWCEPGARTASAMADGSVHTRRFPDDGLRADPGERAGPMARVTVTRGANAGRTFDAHGWVTWNGLRGRDFKAR